MASFFDSYSFYAFYYLYFLNSFVIELRSIFTSYTFDPYDFYLLRH
jgi:hypothetical protein